MILLPFFNFNLVFYVSVGDSEAIFDNNIEVLCKESRKKKPGTCIPDVTTLGILVPTWIFLNFIYMREINFKSDCNFDFFAPSPENNPNILGSSIVISEVSQ